MQPTALAALVGVGLLGVSFGMFADRWLSRRLKRCPSGSPCRKAVLAAYGLLEGASSYGPRQSINAAMREMSPLIDGPSWDGDDLTDDVESRANLDGGA